MKQKSLLSPTFRQGSVWDFMNEVEKAFEDIWETNSPANLRTRSQEPMTRYVPPVDVHETDEYYLMSFDLPGVAEKDIQVSINDGRLTVSGERKAERSENTHGLRRFERSYGHFERSFQVPTQITEDKIQARFENGVLEVMMPKSERAKARAISVEGKGGLFSKLLGQKAKGEVSTAEEKH